MDVAQLEYEMKRKKVSKGDMCKKLGISRSAFYRKCNGRSEFTQSEIQKIATILELKDLAPIFFNEKVS
ncbi:MAG: helix-turn-helix transcriptional regulator [Firmicutes bacterium]|nr:helix-turn-helix transcriptional regulator [Bacillota bacterium]MDY6159303.1 helix-turn-helix transcriptional regulator [Candidatus Faecousia sp.]